MAKGKELYYSGRKIPITISIPQDLKQELDEIAKITKWSRSQVIREFFLRYWKVFYEEVKRKWTE
jgi:metal-responsive CopG/Arc/MetJ family transcriptional regulator